jgi:kinase binding protein CGI-121
MSSNLELHCFELKEGWDTAFLSRVLDAYQGLGKPVIIDPFAIFDISHLSFSLMHAARSLVRNRSRARDPAVEVIRCLAGTHQISSSMEIICPSVGSRNVLVLVLPADWPEEKDGKDVHDLSVKGSPPEISGLDHVEDIPFGGRNALERYGLEDSGSKEMNRNMILEHLSTIEWN